jgi:pyruvate dehydrogenase E2 component (dihydrolipoamide acetyltransferase)
MSTEVRVPTTGNAGEDAVLVEWQVAVGDVVQPDTVLAIVETAKTTMDVVAPVGGIVVRLLAEPGDEVPEFGVIAEIGNAGVTEAGTVNEPAIDQLRISPRARIMAERRGLDPGRISGTGPMGRILISDVMRAVQASPELQSADVPVAKPVPTAPVPTAPVPTAPKPSGERIPLRGARKVTAQRMADAVSNVAAVTLQRTAPADVLLGFAGRLKGVEGPRIGINELVMFAVASTLARHPQANAHFSWEGITQFADVHLGFAVDNGRALLVPVIQHAQRTSLTGFATESRRLTDLALNERLTPEHMEGATFTVTNLGAFGVEWFTPIVSPPQVCILGVGAVQYRDGTSHLPLSLTFDHRALDGAAAARCLADISSAIASIDVVAALTETESSNHAQ